MIIIEWGYVFEHEGLPGTSQAVFFGKEIYEDGCEQEQINLHFHLKVHITLG